MEKKKFEKSGGEKFGRGICKHYVIPEDLILSFWNSSFVRYGSAHAAASYYQV